MMKNGTGHFMLLEMTPPGQDWIFKLGSEPMEGNYWVKVENGTDPETLKNRKDNPIWNEIQNALN